VRARTPKKSILLFIEDVSFTLDNRMQRISGTLVRDGWDVTVISPRFRGDPGCRVLGEHLRAYFYPKPNARGALGHLVEHAISIGLGFLYSLWSFLRHGFSLFYACNPMDIFWLVALPYKALGCRFIFDQHDLCPELLLSRERGVEKMFFYRALLFLERMSYRMAVVVISTNESYKRVAIERGGKRPEDVYVVRNGPDLKKFKIVEPEAGVKKDGEVLVGYLGTMNIQDGVDYLLRAAQIIKAKDEKCIRFLLVGGGANQAYLMRLSDEMGLGGMVRFTGRLPDDEMLAALSAMDICVQPDPMNPLNDKSTMNKVMEYMALGKPVLAFDLTETRVSCGEAAVYAKPNEVEDLADQIIQLARDPLKRERMGRLGRKRVEQQLAWEYSEPKLLEACARALEP